jgi:hypothetical protein
MLCDHCYGKYRVRQDSSIPFCPECGGSGILHCCDGLVAQPEDSGHAPAAPCRSDPADSELVAALPRGDSGVQFVLATNSGFK